MFNLITDAWVPVTYRDGHRALVGLRQLMVDAEAINPQLDIPDASVARAIERLLIAVVYQATKPTAWAALWHKAWPAQRVLAYLDRWRDRFDLDQFGQYLIASAAKAHMGPWIGCCWKDPVLPGPRRRCRLPRLHEGCWDGCCGIPRGSAPDWPVTR